MQTSIPSAEMTHSVMWLSLREDVLAHLFYAAAEIGEVRIDSADESLNASLAFPNEATDSVDVFFSQQTPPPASAIIRVRYHHDGNSYEFLTVVSQGIDGRRWRLAIPTAVARWSGRREDRYRTDHLKNFTITLERDDGEGVTLPLQDLSTQGLSMCYSPLQMQLSVNQELIATLNLSDGIQLPVLLEVRYSRSAENLRRVAGCYIRGISPSSRATLGQIIADLGVR
ncbi:MAG: PilZ domain-containing protein [Myxococcota bacterium]